MWTAGRAEDLGRVARQRQALEVEPLAGPGEVGVGDGGQGQPRAGALLEHRAAALEDLDDARTDGAEPQKADTHVTDAAHRGFLVGGPVSGSGS